MSLEENDRATASWNRAPFAAWGEEPQPVESETTEDCSRMLRAMTDQEWVLHYSALTPAPSTAAARVALADAAPAQFLRDTGREPPSDLVARVFAAYRMEPAGE
jgi:uncharacterized protein (DUF924 family)